MDIFSYQLNLTLHAPQVMTAFATNKETRRLFFALIHFPFDFPEEQSKITRREAVR